MCYAASKLWNVCNYERQHYKEMGFEKYPDWYYQKSHREICGINSFHLREPRKSASCWIKHGNLLRLEKIWEGLRIPDYRRFKQESIPITYMQMGIVHEWTQKKSVCPSKSIKRYMEETYQIHENFRSLKGDLGAWIRSNSCGSTHSEKGECKVIVVYEISRGKNFAEMDTICQLIWDFIIYDML